MSEKKLELTIDEFASKVVDPAQMQLAIDMLLEENDRLRGELDEAKSLLEDAAHVIVEHKCKEVAESWTKKWGKKYNRFSRNV